MTAADPGTLQRSPKNVFARSLRRTRILARLWRLYWLRAEIRFAPTENQRLFALTIVIGSVCGLAAVAFHLTIQFVGDHLIERAMGAPGRSWIAWTILTPTLGGLGCGALLYYLFPGARGSGIPEVKAAFAIRGRRVRLRDAAAKFGLGALQIGTGASLGREGPTVQICAGLASLCGRLARISPKNVRRLLPVGAAAGIAAAFNAPIAAVTFTIEEIVGDLDKSVLSGVIVAAAIAAVIERSVLGEHPVFELSQPYGFHHAASLLVYAALGLASALVAVVFSEALLRLRKGFRALASVLKWTGPGLGGLVTGLLAVGALAWFGSRGITGGGYSTLERALGGALGARVMLALCAMKLVATVVSYSSGGAGGIFAPALFVGGMLGGAFGVLDARLFGHPDAVVGTFTLVGMGAVFAGVIRAPMTSVLILVEMTGGYSLILPLMIANMIAYGLARRLRPTQIYDALLEQDGVHVHGAAAMGALERVHLDQVVARGAPLVTFEPTTRARELVQAGVAQEVYPVVDRAGRLAGIVTLDEIKLLEQRRDLETLVNAADVMLPPVSVKRSDDLRTALEEMLANGIRRLPVVDDDGRVVGLVDEGAIARVYLRSHTARKD